MLRKISLRISLYMAITMSFCLSIIGNVEGYIMSGGKRPLPALITGIAVSFVVGFIISMLIGMVVPMKKVEDAVCRKAHTSVKSLKGKLLNTLVSDVIYTPIISTVQVILGYIQMPENQRPPFIGMWLSSVVICMLFGYIIVFIFQPIYMNKTFSKFGIEM